MDAHAVLCVLCKNVLYARKDNMHKLIRTHDSTATRFVELINETSRTIDMCFDDSALVSFENFSFMKKEEV